MTPIETPDNKKPEVLKCLPYKLKVRNVLLYSEAEES